MPKCIFVLALFFFGYYFGQNPCDSLFRLADSVYRHQGEKAAIAFYDKIIAANCDPGKAYNNRGFFYNETGQYQEALKDFDSALKADPANAEAYANESVSYNLMGNHAMASIAINKAISLSPTNALLYKLRGDVKYSEEKYDSAIIDYKKSIALNPADLKLYTHVARTYERLMHAAFATADKTANDKTTHADPNAIGLNLSDIVYAARDSAAAILTLLINRNPYNKRLIYNRAEFYRRNFLYDQAIPDYLQGLKNNGDDYEMLCNLAYCYDGNGDKETALKYYAKSIAVKPNLLAYVNRGRLYKKAGRLKEAMADEQNAIAIDSTDAQAYLILGNCYLALNQIEKAKTCYQKGLEQQPQGEIKDLLDIQMAKTK